SREPLPPSPSHRPRPAFGPVRWGRGKGRPLLSSRSGRLGLLRCQLRWLHLVVEPSHPTVGYGHHRHTAWLTLLHQPCAERLPASVVIHQSMSRLNNHHPQLGVPRLDDPTGRFPLATRSVPRRQATESRELFARSEAIEPADFRP